MSTVELQTPARPLGGKSEEKRNAIVSAAEALFLENGFAATSMDAIALKAGVSKRTVYSHFENKELLFAAVMSGVCARVGGDPVISSADPVSVDDLSGDLVPEEMLQADIRDVLIAVGTRFLRIMTSEEAVRLFAVVLAEARRAPAIGETFYKTGPMPMIARLGHLFETKMKEGSFHTDDPERSAWWFLVLVKDPFHFQRIVLGTPRPSEQDRLDHVEAAVDFFLNAHRPRG